MPFKNKLLSYLSDRETITISKFQKLAGINRWLAEKIVVNLIVIDVVTMQLSEKQCLYK
jgi:uncharacterized membrane protein SirB2